MSVTIKDIAREAGVSYASVSRALSGSRGVSVKTAQRILAVAKKLNYLPNGIARNLVNQRSKTLGLILPDISNPFFSDIALAVIHTAERAGYQTILSNTDWEPRAQERQLQLMREQRVDGIILKPVQDTVDGAAYENLGLPAVLLHYSGSKVVSCVDTDHDYGGYLMTRHLLDCGCRRIAFLGGLPDSRSNLQRLEGYTRALLEPERCWKMGLRRMIGSCAMALSPVKAAMPLRKSCSRIRKPANLRMRSFAAMM